MFSIEWDLAPSLVLGALLSVPLAAYTVKKLDGKHLKVVVDWVTLDDWGRAYSTGSDGLLKGWDLRHNTRLTVSGTGRTKRTWRYPGGKILVESDALCIFDPENESFQAFSLPMETEISDISVCPDEKIVAALSGGIGVFAPNKELCKFSLIKAHAHSTLGCLTLGPKILTCSRESAEQNDLRISGTELFVKHESDKLSLQA